MADETDGVAGRVNYLLSGQVTRFASRSKLKAFVLWVPQAVPNE
jgi:hypothetical protein